MVYRPDMAIRVLYIEQGEFLGGGELFSVDVLGELRQQPHPVHAIVATTDPSSAYALQIREIGWPVTQVSLPSLARRPWLAGASAASLVRAIREHAPDVVHTNTLRGHLLASAVLGIPGATPLTWMLHDFNYPPALLRLSSHVPAAVAALPAVADWAGSITPGCRHKLTEMVNGLDHEQLAAIRPVQLPGFGPSAGEEAIHVGFVGAIAPWKGVRHFVLAARDLYERGLRARFYIAGPTHAVDEPYERQLRRLAGEAPIHWLGWRDDALAVIAGLDVLVHTSVDPEPFGRVVLEGMALGTPVIATDAGGPSRIITHEADGLLVRPGDTGALVRAIERLSGDERLRRRLAKAGQKTTQQRYRLADVAARMVTMWEGVLS